MSEHTPGPLSIKRADWADNVNGYDYAIIDAQGKIIGEAFEVVGANEKRPCFENAKLWASAPDLLAERDRLREENRRLNEALDEVRDLIDGYVDVVDGDYGQPRPNKAMRAVQIIDAVREARAAIQPQQEGEGHAKANPAKTS